MSLFDLFKKNGTRKKYEHRPSFVPQWKKLPDSILDEYAAGLTLFDLSIKYRASADAVRTKLESFGGIIRPKGFHGRAKPDNRTKLTAEQIQWILEQDDKDVSHAEIARKIGNITRERVRQICVQHQHQTRRSRMTKCLAMKEAREARELRHQQWIREISDLYKSGATWMEISAAVNTGTTRVPTPQHGASRVAWLRQKYPTLFPPRNPRAVASRKLTQEEWTNRVAQISKAWKSGTHAADIAEQFGFKSRDSLQAFVSTQRVTNPEMFPARAITSNSAAMSKRREVVSELWNQGLSAIEIARTVGYRNPNSVYQFVKREREAFPALFPNRRIG